ncbi:MAG: metallophosphoesterase [Candidatus Lokiarchaeota archaeon]|nr:metallophosphoesterase [Candidatus Lokiarchaeota archaeon]
MNFLLLTDIEGYTPEIHEKYFQDLVFVVIAGDIAIGAKNLSRNAKFYQRIRVQIPVHIPVYYIPGNREYENVASEFEGIPENFIPIHNRYVTHNLSKGSKVHLIGYGGALPGFFNNFVKTEEEFEQALDILFQELKTTQLDQDIVVLVVHNPPFSNSLDVTFRGEHIGSYSIRNIIEKYKPDYCVCGHVHESQSIEEIGTTKCVNPGASKNGNAAILSLDSDFSIELITINAHRLKSK